jgi:uncharacterized protein
VKHRLVIELDHLPEEGRGFAGELGEEVFDLPGGDAEPAGPLVFDVHVQRFGSELMVRGRLEAPFRFICVRTLHPFIKTIRLDDAVVAMEIPATGRVDVTEALREEILIQFPLHPRCDDGDDPQHCEIDPRYLSVDNLPGDALPTPPRAGGDDRWSALDRLKNTHEQP